MERQPTKRNTSQKKKLRSGFGSRTDIGCVRQVNEDNLIVSAPLFAVADGMGGHAAGEVASEIAINTLVEKAPDVADGDRLGDAVAHANLAVMAAAEKGRGRKGMGTTMTATMIDGDRIVIAHVGDSRAYLLYQGKIQQLTRDHSLMSDMIEAGQLTPEEARFHPNRSVITRALGSDPHMLPDIYEIYANPGDRLLLCTDGLSGMVRDEVIEEHLQTITDPQLCADRLVDDALAAGGHDNVTVIIVDITSESEKQRKKTTFKGRIFAVSIILALILVFATAIAAFNFWAKNSYYLAESDGRVAIYQGIPGSLFGFQASELIFVSDVELSDLKGVDVKRIQENIRFDTLHDAEESVAQYRKDAARGEVPGQSTRSEPA